jgi:hypothetical protein
VVCILKGCAAVLQIVCSALSCCIACCGKDEAADSAEDDSGVQKLER